MGMLQNQNPPSFPLPPDQYDPAYINKLLNTLRLFLNQVNAQQILSLNGIIFDITHLPTDADVSSLRPGQVYRDTTAGNALKVKV